MLEAFDVIAAAAADSADAHADAIIRAENFAAERESRRANCDCFAGCLNELTPFNGHLFPPL
jgi:hypothetical protein